MYGRFRGSDRFKGWFGRSLSDPDTKALGWTTWGRVSETPLGVVQTSQREETEGQSPAPAYKVG
jgi:hypothetical protein